MSIDWNGMERFLSGDESGQWMHFTSQSTLECVEAHREAVQRNKEMQVSYVDGYDQDLSNPSVKYDYTGRLE